MAKLWTLTGVLVILSVVHVHSLPRKRLVNSLRENSRSSKLASVLTDYWAERGFHDAYADDLIGSESQGRDLLTGDDDFREKTVLRIPRGRLAPPAVVTKQYSTVKKISALNRQQRKRLRALKQQRLRYPRVRLMNHLAPYARSAQRKQDDMEILESVTLIDGGTPHSDGSISVRPSEQQSQRKYHQGHAIDEDQISPLNYQLADDDLTLQYKHMQQQYHQGLPHPRQPIVSASYHAMPNPGYPHGQMEEPHGKLSIGQYKQPKSIPFQNTMSLNQFQQQLFEQQQLHQQQQQPPVPPPHHHYSSPKPQVLPIFVIPSPHKTEQLHAPLGQPSDAAPPPPPPPQPSPTPLQFQTTPPPPPILSSPSPSKPNTQFNPQFFQNQFQHPFATEPPSPISSLAQLTAALLSGASNIAAATSSAAAALAKGAQPLITSPPTPQTTQPAIESTLYESYAPPPHISPSQYEGLGPLSSGILSAASIPSASQVLLPTNNALNNPFAAQPSRPGVIADDELAQQNASGTQEESLVGKITQLVETGRKILYFPKGVMDTVDVLFKQMERNPAVAYWGDKFFAKVFGDTSGT